MVAIRRKATGIFKVGAVRFELTTFWTRTKRCTDKIPYYLMLFMLFYLCVWMCVFFLYLVSSLLHIAPMSSNHRRIHNGPNTSTTA